MDKVRDSLRWVLVHPIAFAWILAFIAIVLNYWVGSRAPEAKNAAHAQVEATNPHPAPAQAVPGGHAVATTAAAPASGTEAQTHQATQAATATSAVQATPEAAAQATPAAATQAATETVAAPAATETAAAATSATQAAQSAAPVTGNIEPVDTVTAVLATTTIAANDVSDALSLLKAARQAYWLGVKESNRAKLEEAVSWYEKLIAQDANPSHKGELANVFWKMENPEKAADLYIDIGPWLKEQGRTIELINMKVYVDITNPEKGKKLGALIGQ